MKVAVCVRLGAREPELLRALQVARRLAPDGSLMALAAGAEALPTGFVPRLGLSSAVALIDSGLEGAGPHARAAALARLAAHRQVDLLLVGGSCEDDDSGLFPAALAHYRGAAGLFRIEDAQLEPGSEDTVVATVRLGGRLRRLRVRPPAVLSVVGLAPEPAPLRPGAARIETLTLADVGLDAAALPTEPAPTGIFAPARRKPAVITDIKPLLARGA
jgi:electron transfer flavoprotein alpha/beta subunit